MILFELVIRPGNDLVTVCKTASSDLAIDPALMIGIRI